MSENLQNELYEALQAVSMAALNPGWTYVAGSTTPWTNGTLHQKLPPIPVIQDMQDQGAPTNGPYVTIQQSATMLPIGSTHDVLTINNAGVRIRKQPYEAHVKFQETNSAGNLLLQIREFIDTEEGQAILDGTNVAVQDFGNVSEVSMVLDGRWLTQVFADVVCTIASGTAETISTISTMPVTGTIS